MILLPLLGDTETKMSEIYSENNEYYPKRNIYLPTKMIEALQQDADRFEAFKKKHGSRNMNNFISCLLLGYYEDYSEERNELAASVRRILENEISDTQILSNMTTCLLNELSPRSRNYEKEKKMPHLPYKPTKDTWGFIRNIELSSNDTVSSLSKYLRDMFASYLSLPIYEREKIIFKESVAVLEKAIEKGQAVILSSLTGGDRIFRVIPYKLQHSSEEMFNYLLCQSYNDYYKTETPFTMRLCRIQKPKIVTGANTVNPEIQHLLDLMSKRTPQYTIYKDEISCVLITKKGLRTYNRIYHSRPDPLEDPPIENLPDGSRKYYFNHSRDQLKFYFRRFEADEAIVLYPPELAEEIKTFHEDAWKAYEKGKSIEA